MNDSDKQPPFHSGYVAIVGEPNVGKSTLMNALLGQKISIVTNKPQTTRHKIFGILSKENVQIIFLDTPGIVEPKYRLHDAMMSAAFSALNEADLILYMVDCEKVKNPETIKQDTVLNKLKPLKKNIVLVINKCDLLTKQELLPIIAVYAEQFPFKEVFPISSLKGFGLEEMVATLGTHLPEHPPFYPVDIVSIHPERFFVAEIIREKIFEKFREEIPYSTSVDIVEFTEVEGKKDMISAEIYIERESQKAILIGKGGIALKEIGSLARTDIEKFLDRPVFLSLHVKVREKWRNDKSWLQRLGYNEEK